MFVCLSVQAFSVILQSLPACESTWCWPSSCFGCNIDCLFEWLPNGWIVIFWNTFIATLRYGAWKQSKQRIKTRVELYNIVLNCKVLLLTKLKRSISSQCNNAAQLGVGHLNTTQRRIVSFLKCPNKQKALNPSFQSHNTESLLASHQFFQWLMSGNTAWTWTPNASSTNCDLLTCLSQTFPKQGEKNSGFPSRQWMLQF